MLHCVTATLLFPGLVQIPEQLCHLCKNVDPNLINLAQVEIVGLFQDPAAGAVKAGNHGAKTYERFRTNPAGFTRVGLIPA